MMRTSMRAIVVLVSAAAMLLAGAAGAEARPPVPVHSTTVHPVTAPEVMRPGLVHLRNTGGDELYLFRKIRAGAPTLVKDLNASLKSDDPGPLARHFTIVDVLNPHSDVFVRLVHGTYFVADADAEHYHRADIHRIVVKGARDNATTPHSRPVTVTSRNHLVAPATVHRGQFVHVRNFSGRLQAIIYFRVDPKATKQQLADFLAHPTPDQLFPLMADVVDGAGELAAMSKQQNAYVRFPAHAGRYFVLSLPIDRTNGLDTLLAANRIRLVTAR